MSYIGFRASPSKVTFALLNENNELTMVDSVNVPLALSVPDQLRFLRTTLLDIISEFKVKQAFVRVSEPNTMSKNISRMNIEGVLQELIAGASVEKYMAGQISKITKLLNVERTQFKRWIDGNEPFQDIHGWNRKTLDEKEAIISAFAAEAL